MSTTLSAAPRARSTTRFARHGLGMAVAMVAGMVAYVTIVGLIAGSVDRARLGQPELYALGMAAAMCVPMVAWMRRHGHAWRLCNEMTAAMLLPYVVLIVLYRAGALGAGAICPLGCAFMFPAMIAAMLYRRDEYS